MAKNKKNFNRDKAYCVIDKDKHKDYQSTLNKIQQAPQYKSVKINVANSEPCFELWILFHFEKTTKSFQSADEIESHLKKQKYIKNYRKKETREIYSCLKGREEIAIENAKFNFREKEKAGGDIPFTMLHLLIEDLIAQSKK